MDFQSIGMIYAGLYALNMIVVYKNLKSRYRDYDILVGDIVVELLWSLNPFRSLVALGYSVEWICNRLGNIMDFKLIEKRKK